MEATGLTATAMLALANANIVDARLSGDNLILTNRGGVDIDVGAVKGLPGADGSNAVMWGTATQLATIGNSQAAVVKDDVAGLLIKVGDLIVSRHASSNGLYGRVTAVASQASVTVLTLGSFLGPSPTLPNEGASLSIAALTNASTSWLLRKMDTKSADTPVAMFDVPNGCISIVTTGVYLIGGSVKTPSFAATHVSQMALVKSVSAYSAGDELIATSTPNLIDAAEMNISTRVALTAGDKVAFWFKFDATSSISLTKLRLWAQRVQ